jgi:hypothetical protein
MSETQHFLAQLLRNAPPSAYLTLTAIHPDHKHRTPSRHIPVHDHAQQEKGLADLLRANALGWGAYVAIGFRGRDLGRWRRGGNADVLALPALFVDVDDQRALARLQAFQPAPSWLVHTGGGYHAYWWLDTPLTDMRLGKQYLDGLASVLGGDVLSVSQSLRLVGSRNTKQQRKNALCHTVQSSDRRYALHDFAHLLAPEPRAPPRNTSNDKKPHMPRRQTRYAPKQLNSQLIQAVTHRLMRDYGARPSTDGWLASRCPLHHHHDSIGAHFAFKPSIGCGVCHGKHGTLRLDTLCSILSIHPQDYGGIYAQEKV